MCSSFFCTICGKTNLNSPSGFESCDCLKIKKDRITNEEIASAELAQLGAQSISLKKKYECDDIWCPLNKKGIKHDKNDFRCWNKIKKEP